MYTKILVALDGSPLAEKGLESAVATAKQNPNSKLVLLTIVQTSEFGEGISDGGGSFEQLQLQLKEAMGEMARIYMAHQVAKYKSEGVDMQVEIGWGDAAEEIVGYAEKNQIDLIVITTRGRSGLKKFFLGSVAAKVISTSPVPVLVLPPDRR
jgi:nucleotide-binding universal stress UspA family protein